MDHTTFPSPNQISGYDGIGRHARFRFSCREALGFKSPYPHHVRRTQLRSVSAVCVRAAKTSHTLSPSSFPNRSSLGVAPIRYLRVRIWIAPMHHVGVHSARLGKSNRKRGCFFLICAPWLLLSKSDPLRWAPIWIPGEVRIWIAPGQQRENPVTQVAGFSRCIIHYSFFSLQYSLVHPGMWIAMCFFRSFFPSAGVEKDAVLWYDRYPGRTGDDTGTDSKSSIRWEDPPWAEIMK